MYLSSTNARYAVHGEHGRSLLGHLVDQALVLSRIEKADEIALLSQTRLHLLI